MSAQDNLSPEQFSKGTRVQHVKTNKVGTTTRDPHEGGNGPAVYVKWDTQKTREVRPYNLKVLRPE